MCTQPQDPSTPIYKGLKATLETKVSVKLKPKKSSHMNVALTEGTAPNDGRFYRWSSPSQLGPGPLWGARQG